MAIEVLLRRSIEGVGSVGQVVRVKNGYARNYLLPYQMAALVTPQALRNIEKDKAAEAVREAEAAQERSALSERLAGIELRIESRAGEDGHLYGSVGPRQVIDVLKRHGIRFEERQVRFETVRQLGEYEVPIQLSRQHSVKVKLWVVLDPEDAKQHAELAAQRSAEEAQAARYAAEHPQAAPASAPAEGAPAAQGAAAAEKPAKAKKGRGEKSAAPAGDAAPAPSADGSDEKASAKKKGDKAGKQGGDDDEAAKKAAKKGDKAEKKGKK